MGNALIHLKKYKPRKDFYLSTVDKVQLACVCCCSAREAEAGGS